MPAAPFSAPAPVLDQLSSIAARTTPALVPPAGLLAVFAQVTDPRKRRGTRHQLPILLTLATCAVLAGARSFTAVGEWAANASETVCTALGIARVPDESTFRRVFARLDADMLDVALGAWAAAATTPAQGERRRIAVDGKTLRGSRHGYTPGRHLLAAGPVPPGRAGPARRRREEQRDPRTESPAQPGRAGRRDGHRRCASRRRDNASNVTVTPVSAIGRSRVRNTLVSLVFASTSTWPTASPAPWVTAENR